MNNIRRDVERERKKNTRVELRGWVNSIARKEKQKDRQQTLVRRIEKKGAKERERGRETQRGKVTSRKVKERQRETGRRVCEAGEKKKTKKEQKGGKNSRCVFAFFSFFFPSVSRTVCGSPLLAPLYASLATALLFCEA